MYEAYLITNDITGQQYVGVSRLGYLERLKQHWKDAISEQHSDRGPTKIHADMIKYGMEHFHSELLEGNIPDEPKELNEEAEKKYIAQHQTYYLDGKDGYNMTRGGHGTIGYIFTDKDRQKMSSLHKGKPLNLTPEGKEARRARMLKENRPFKQEWKDAIREKRLGKYTGQENPFYGKHHSDAVKNIIRNNNSGSPILQYDKDWNFIAEFFNLNDAGKWVVSQNLSSARYDTCAVRIAEVCKSDNLKCTAYGYHWKKKEGQSTNYSQEDELPDEAQSTV